VTDPIETTSPGRSPFATKARTLAFGVLATAALSLPALSAGVVAHEAGRTPTRFQPTPISPISPISPDSHRLALSVSPLSLRLT
jgi:hypothetical protein